MQRTKMLPKTILPLTSHFILHLDAVLIILFAPNGKEALPRNQSPGSKQPFIYIISIQHKSFSLKHLSILCSAQDPARAAQGPHFTICCFKAHAGLEAFQALKT